LLGEIEGWEPLASEWRSEIEELRIRAGELARDAHRRLDEIDVEPQRLDEVEQRLARLERLFRKYGATSAEVLESARRIGAEIEDLTLDEDEREGLEAEVASALEDYRHVAESLSEARRRWAAELAGRVHAELADLAMKRATFSVALGHARRSDSPLVIDGYGVWFGAEGIDEVTFELAANPGEPKKALAEVASGGELSRSYLALRLAAGEGFERSAAALVFDEVDAGVGGAEAAALGRKLHRLAADGQVLAVTHLPQVASCGDRHHRVRKKIKSERTTIEVELLSEERRVEEIARLLAGRKVTELSRSHARELLAGAR
jgi:DNA repair protein RecN (Recombination protein N)